MCQTKKSVTVYSQMQGKFFSLNLALKYVRSSSISILCAEMDHAKLDQSEPDHAESYHGQHYQIVI